MHSFLDFFVLFVLSIFFPSSSFLCSPPAQALSYITIYFRVPTLDPRRSPTFSSSANLYSRTASLPLLSSPSLLSRSPFPSFPTPYERGSTYSLRDTIPLLSSLPSDAQNASPKGPIPSSNPYSILVTGTPTEASPRMSSVSKSRSPSPPPSHDSFSLSVSIYVVSFCFISSYFSSFFCIFIFFLFLFFLFLFFSPPLL